MCDCQDPQKCPLQGKCLSTNVVYHADVIPDNNEETSFYIGLAEKFKPRFNNHNHSFRKQNLKISTELSKKIWELKEKGVSFTIKWKIFGQKVQIAKYIIF